MMNSWDHLWLRRCPPHALAFTRVALGLYLLLYAGLYVPHISVLFSNTGLVLPLYFHFVPSPIVAHMMYVVFLLAITCFTIGYAMRFSVALIIVMGLYYWQLQLHLFPASYNRILFFTMITLLCSGSDRTFSVRMKLRYGSWYAWEPICILPQRIITLQIFSTFFGVNIQKWMLPDWQGGGILAYSFLSRWATPISAWYARLPLTHAHYDAVVFLIKILGPLSAFGLWFPRTRTLCVGLFTLFLLLVSSMLAIWWFVFIIPAFILFYKPENVHLWFVKYAHGRVPKNSVNQTK